MQISLESIDQSYGGHPLFRQLQLIIPSGQFFTLLGPSGCGKTTLLRMLAGFIRPNRGRILFGAEDMTTVPVHRRGIGLVFQDYALFPDRSVLANVAYGLLARNIPRSVAIDRAVAMIERVGLGAYVDQRPAELSGGQRQRVAMARALVIAPQVLLLDEPLCALDVPLRVALRGMIRDLQQEAGITTVFVTHDHEEALALSDQIAVMNRGGIVQIGTPNDIYNKPKTAFVSSFVGSANLIPILREGTPTSGGVRRLETRAGVLHTTSDGECTVGASLSVRCAEISVGDPATLHEGTIAGVIDHAEFRGSTVGYAVSTAVGKMHVESWKATQPGMRRRGESVLLRIPLTARIVAGDAC